MCLSRSIFWNCCKNLCLLGGAIFKNEDSKNMLLPGQTLGETRSLACKQVGQLADELQPVSLQSEKVRFMKKATH